jgi:hypothetical protein
MKNVVTVAFAVLLTAVFIHPGGRLNAAPPIAQVAAGTVTVTVTYKGKGTVDASHKLWVYLFDTPNIGAGVMPLGQIALDKNGANAVFHNVSGDKVYVAVAFDESGAMMGDAPPPGGSPIGILMGSDGAPSAVTPGAKTGAVLNFDDTIRMP